MGKHDNHEYYGIFEGAWEKQKTGKGKEGSGLTREEKVLEKEEE